MAGSGEKVMAIIIAFPADAALRRTGPEADLLDESRTASITILPVVRIERHAEAMQDGNTPEQGETPPRGRRRRART